MAVYFFSDAHLGADNPADEKGKIEKLFSFLEMVGRQGNRLYILGDLFDFWFEYKQVIPKQHLTVVFRLAGLVEKGIPIHYITGNHDFWLGDFLEKEVGLVIHRDRYETVEEEKKLLLLHGDGLSPSDWKYRLFVRSILRHRLCIALYRLLPPDWAIPFARKMSSSSRNHTAGRKAEFIKDYEIFAEKKLIDGYDAVIIGHTHHPQYIAFPGGVYLNTGDFYHHFSYGRLENGRLSLEYFRP